MCDRLRGFLVPGMIVVFFKESHSKFGWNLELWLVAIWLPGIYRRSDLRCSSCRYLRRGFEISVVVIRLGMPPVDDGFESSRDFVTPPVAVIVTMLLPGHLNSY